MNDIVFIDVEIETKSKKVLDIGAVSGDDKELHSRSSSEFIKFLHGCKYICGHNIINHDLKYLKNEISKSGAEYFIDTLYLSPLLFPKKPYHRLVKDDILLTDELNNPLNDAKKARDLFHDEIAAFSKLDKQLQSIYVTLLGQVYEFKSFFQYIDFKSMENDVISLIHNRFNAMICVNAPIEKMASKYPTELAYALALISVIKYDSITPPWVIKNYPRVENILRFLRNRSCSSCPYCSEYLDEKKALKRFFKFDDFRSYNGEPLQQSAVTAAVKDKSILVVFPTGGGKSVTFQLPALMAGENEKGLTVVISPLQSLMKDQTDNLEHQYNIVNAVTINGSLDPIERAVAVERVENGSASLLYISPESLRSKSIETLLLKRNIVRFVIDEAHCFSTWGQDFRVDYLYIGDFIKKLNDKKRISGSIPVSCFTATAKKKVISDICDYFSEKLFLDLEVFRASATRTNLSFHIINEGTDDDKMFVLRQLLYDNDCPTIIYTARVRTTELLAAALTGAGIPAKPYNGKMDRLLRIATQEEFMRGELNTIVATTAFGMGVDKRDVGMVIHYDISSSVEDYVQEAGRAGRDETIEADCFVLYDEDDLNKHFMLLNQTKVTQKEIRQIWRAIKNLTGFRESISQSALEIAREAGWDDTIKDMETRVRTAVNALEQSGFVRREQNLPRVYADSILVRNMEEAKARIENSAKFDDTSRTQAVRIMSNLISAKNKARGMGDDGESYVDYISDKLGIEKWDVIRVIGILRDERILADAKDLVTFMKTGDRQSKPESLLDGYRNIEQFLLMYLDDGEKTYNLKEMNEALSEVVPDASIKRLDTVLNFYEIKQYIKRIRKYGSNYITLKPQKPLSQIVTESNKRCNIAKVIIDYLFMKKTNNPKIEGVQSVAVEFSVLELKKEFAHNLFGEKAEAQEIEDALYYLQKIDAVRIDGGFLVMYNAMRIDRLERNNRVDYNKEHYAKLEDFYKNKRQKIHIVGEYAKRLIGDYKDAMTFVDDYFVMEHDLFLHKYFSGRSEEISRNITPMKFKQLFGELSPAQLKIIKDKDSKYIIVAAGPGSGKTKLLTHKLASLYMMEDVKHEQMLMLTFSRAAATEFKKRLKTLIGGAANFISIKTFHSFCFDILGRVGDLDKSGDIIEYAVKRIKAGEADMSRLTKTVIVIDEAQDMSAAEFILVEALMDLNNELRVIAVGDDDQNIYEFRGSSSSHFESLMGARGAKQYELLENYRSNANIVEFANRFAEGISRRMKSKPIISVRDCDGTISICRLTAPNITIPVVNAVLEYMPEGSTCIAARTNAEALNIAGYLIKKGITARLIQTNSDFSLHNLAEIRDFTDYLERESEGHSIDDEVWQNALSLIKRKYTSSSDIQSVFRLLGDFSEICGMTKYKSDLNQYIRESKLEDFISSRNSAILVSTIHQTKGREFDNMFLALSGITSQDDETKRAIYVALTRAKKNLYIYCNSGYFDRINTDSIIRCTDNTNYPEPAVISMQLSHRDVALGYFSYKRREIDKLVSGQELNLTDAGCFAGEKQVLKFSSSFKRKIDELSIKGYIPVKAVIRHIVFWQDKDKDKDKNKDKESKIILPDLEFAKMDQE